MTRWWWVRHAPVPHLADEIYGSTDPDADVTNEQAFARLAAHLPTRALWVVSQLRRTRQTAEAIGRSGYPLPELLVEPAFGEQDLGELHGRKHTDHTASRNDPFIGFWPVDPHVTAPGGESWLDVHARVLDAVRRLSAANTDRDIVCVSHGGPIRAALAAALDLTPAAAMRFSVSNLSITRIDRLHVSRPGGPDWRVLGVAERPA